MKKIWQKMWGTGGRKKLIWVGLILVPAAAAVLMIFFLPGRGVDRQAVDVLNPPGNGTVEVIDADERGEEEEWGLPFSREDSIDTMQKGANDIRNQIEAVQGKKITVADRATLVSALPVVPGWEMSNPDYHIGAYGADETSNLAVSFKGPEQEIVLVRLIDYGTASAALQPLKMIFTMNNATDDTHRYAKVSSYNDIPVFEEYNKAAKQAEHSFIIKDRYIVHLKCRANDSLQILQQFTAKFDFSRLQ